MKRFTSILFLFFAIWVLLAGCQSDNGNQTEVAKTNTKESPSAKLTEEEAKDILKQLIPKAEHIYRVFNGHGAFEEDETKTIPDEPGYALVIDEKVKSIADLKKVVEEVFTKDCAEKEFYSRYLDPEPAPDYRPLYKDYEGKLYVDANNGGHGWATEFLLDTARIKSQKDHVVEIEFDKTVLDEPSDPVTVKMEYADGKWLLATSLVNLRSK